MFSQQVLAQSGGVEIIFESKPLFSDLNILPGDESTKWVSVKNNEAEDLNVKVEVDSYWDDDSLAKQMRIVINSGVDIYYDETLEQFFSDGEASLSSVLAGSKKVYDSTISFLDATGNDYQGKSLEFNISISAVSESGETQKVSSTGSRGTLFTQKEDLPLVLGEEGEPELLIEKKSSIYLVESGDQVEYTINIENIGNLAAYGVILNDTLPEGFSFSSTGSNEKVWNLGNVYTDEFKTITYLVDVSDGVSAGIYTNVASVLASNHEKIETSSNVEVELENVKVLGIEYELPATGFRFSEFLILISAFFTFYFLAIYFKRNVEKNS